MIRKWIDDGRYAPGEQLPTAKAISQICSVTDQTVRRGLKNLIDEGLLRGAQGKGVFVAQHSLKHRRIALILPNLQDELTILIARGTQRVFDEAGLQCLILDAARDANKEETHIADVANLPVDGAIIFPIASRIITEQIARLKSSKFPFVLVDKYIRDIEVNCVVADDFGGMYSLTSQLIQRGYRNFCWLSGEPESTTVFNRFEGFRWALGDNGIALPRSHVEEIRTQSPTEDLSDKLQKSIEKLLENKQRPEIIVCANDLIAQFTIEHLERMGLAVPDDIGVSGFDALKQNILPIGITSASKPMEEMGKTSAEMLLSLLGLRQHPTQRVVLPVEPTFSASTR